MGGTDLETVAIAAYGNLIKKLLIFAALSFVVPWVGASLAFVYLGLSPVDAIYDAVLSLTLGGGSVGLQGVEKLVVIALSLFGVVFISLLVASITTYVTMRATIEVNEKLFEKEFRASHGEGKQET